MNRGVNDATRERGGGLGVRREHGVDRGEIGESIARVRGETAPRDHCERIGHAREIRCIGAADPIQRRRDVVAVERSATAHRPSRGRTSSASSLFLRRPTTEVPALSSSSGSIGMRLAKSQRDAKCGAGRGIAGIGVGPCGAHTSIDPAARLRAGSRVTAVNRSPGPTTRRWRAGQGVSSHRPIDVPNPPARFRQSPESPVARCWTLPGAF